MIGFGSPTDKLRESVIVLMVSPLALRFVIDHNTERRMEIYALFRPRTRMEQLELPDRTSASQPLRQIDASYVFKSHGRTNCPGFRTAASRCFALFRPSRGVPAVARAYACRVTSLAKAAFFVFLVP